MVVVDQVPQNHAKVVTESAFVWARIGEITANKSKRKLLRQLFGDICISSCPQQIPENGIAISAQNILLCARHVSSFVLLPVGYENFSPLSCNIADA